MINLLNALLNYDLVTLSQSNVVWGIYFILFTVIFLENALLPAAFLPGDSLLLLTGALTAKGILPFFPTLGLLVTASGAGYWVNYLLGQWLGNTQLVQKWLVRMPERYHQRAYILSERYGSLALLVGRFLGFVRTLLPLFAGISGFRHKRFQFFSWIGALLWVYTFMIFGEKLTKISLFRQNETAGMTLLLVFPLVFLMVGIVGIFIAAYRQKK
ncbi:DedA family protein [Morganella morganii]|uniref:DedA family protein n=1 Tax=Morganella morganii TaxID=582 RepID=A0A8I0PZY8_MORMO|nr:DedA family protein [Morganella morganii]MBE8614835.1 DedA family protein [Morganella morganii]